MSSISQKTLFAEFSPADEQAWRAAAEESLEGAPFEKKLITKTPEGVDLQPIYTRASVPAPAWQNRAPGFAPYVRGSQPLGAREQPWLICQEPVGATLADCNRTLLDDLNHGQNAVFLKLDPATRLGTEPAAAGGLPLTSLADVRTLLGKVDLSAVPVMIPAGLAALPITALLATYVREEFGRNDALHGAILADPISEWLRQGKLPGGIDCAGEQMAALVQWAGQNAPRLRTVGIDAGLWGDAGATAVQELAFGLATGVEYLRRLSKLGVSTDEAASSALFTWSLGSHFFLEIAKLRAARLLWSRAVGAAGGNENSQRLVSHGRVTVWNKTVLDPHNNLLRETIESFAAVVGGCQSLEIAPFDAPRGEPTELSRRLARNLHIILAEECQLGRVVDPAGGSYYVETITRQLAEKAWALFQEIEKRGGMVAAIAEGYPQSLIEKTATERIGAVEGRRDGVIGTNLHPNLKETLPEIVGPKPVKHARRTKGAVAADLKRLSPALVTNAAGLFEALGDAFTSGATVAETKARLCTNVTVPAVKVVTPRRRAEPFEVLRRRADAYLAKTGSRPKVFLATMGPRKQHAARADFSAGFFAAGGFEVVPNKGFETPEAAASAALASGAPVVVICSTDDTYPALVPPLAGALKAAGAKAPFLVVAGLPATPELQQQFKSAGVDEFIHIRANCAKLLADVQNRLGLPNL
jgi:methylmalonyl-CoA mutase